VIYRRGWRLNSQVNFNAKNSGAIEAAPTLMKS